jgi:flavodoxin I
VGDQKRYPDHFVDGMGLLYDQVKSTGVPVVGMWPKDGHDYQASAAEVDGRLVGLALDEDNEPGSTPSRIQAWVQPLKRELGL